MLTLDTHLVGVTANRPHPDSYRPDLPLSGEVEAPAGLRYRLDDALDAIDEARGALDEARDRLKSA